MFKSFYSTKILTATLILIAVTALAIGAWLKIPIEVLPSENAASFLFIRVNSIERKTPALIELSLTKNVEGLMKTLPGLQSLQTTTDSSGTSASVNFAPGADLDHLTQIILQGLQGIAGECAIAMDKVQISRSNPEAQPVLRYSVKIPKGENLRKIRDQLRTLFEATPGLSKIDWVGTDPDIYKFTTPYSRMRSMGLDPLDFQNRIRLNETIESLGQLSLQSKVLPVSLTLQANHLDHLRSLTLVPGQSVPLSLLATETLISKQDQDILQLNGQPSYFMDVYAKDRANLFELKKHLSLLIKDIGTHPQFVEIQFQKVLDRIEDLELALDDVFSSLYQAILITTLIVFLFLRNLKKTLVISMTIPLTVLYTILILFVRGSSLNLLTLSGLILCIGMVIDNAILVVDRMMELLQEKSLPARAGRAVDEVISSLIVSSLTNALIFIPMLFIDSDDEFILILKSFIVPIAGSLAASILIAALVVPLVSIYLKMSTDESKESDPFAKRSEPWFRLIPKQGGVILIFSLLFVFFSIDQVKKVETAGLGEATDPALMLKIRFESQIPSTQRKEIFANLQSQILQERERLGFSHVIGEYNPNFVEGVLSIFPDYSDHSDRDLIKANLQTQLQIWIDSHSTPPGVLVGVGDIAATLQKTSPTLYFQYSSLSREQTKAPLQQLEANVLKLPGVLDVQVNRSDFSKPEIQLARRDNLMSLPEAKRNQISQKMQALLSQKAYEDLKGASEPVSARVQILGPTGGWKLDELLHAALPVDRETQFASTFFEVKRSFTESSIVRKNSESQSFVKVKFRSDATAEQRKFVKSVIDGFSFPAGMGIAKNLMLEKIAEMERNTLFIVLLSCFLIYVFLASQFESLFAPLSILFTVPLALLFGVFGLWATGYQLDIMARLSLVLLVGGSVNNAILLIDLIRELRSSGLTRLEAIAIGCSRRLRAVLMTTLIQILSVLPVVFGNAKLMGLPYKTLGLVMVSGLFFSTLLTLVLLPLAYLFFDSIEEALSGRQN